MQSSLHTNYWPALYRAGFFLPKAIFTFFFIFLSFACIAAQNPSATLTFNLGNENEAPDRVSRSKFDCLDHIFAVAKIASLTEGKHAAEFRWINPQGNSQEVTKYKFLVNYGNQAGGDLWAWLKLSRGKGAGLFQWLDPATGLEEFIGEWRVELLIDGKELAKNTFQVNC